MPEEEKVGNQKGESPSSNESMWSAYSLDTLAVKKHLDEIEINENREIFQNYNSSYENFVQIKQKHRQMRKQVCESVKLIKKFCEQQGEIKSGVPVKGTHIDK
jgi:hypothetical protein